jgi:hypothetical protein
MRDTEPPLHGANLSIAVLLKQCEGGALEAVCLRADVCRQDLLQETGATAAHPLGFPAGRRD